MEKIEIKSIEYPTKLENINKYSDNIDIFVETQDGINFTMTICTPQFYYDYMNKEQINYIPAGPPDIIVKELNEEYIFQALQDYCKDKGYWMKAFFLLGETTGCFSVDEMDKIIRRYKG